ncbi:hypothetical protein BDN70DRAFT_883176 [Pholiota conissans]|uniref:Uncharacterized protein n=1 Tax=Pholiota conissans TaxID=109636 RepID=A0A9P5YU68_9AGAR|nr:hypothetical protein BDN70DRAFT_883176 [Pholiota conissans]
MTRIEQLLCALINVISFSMKVCAHVFARIQHGCTASRRIASRLGRQLKEFSSDSYRNTWSILDLKALKKFELGAELIKSTLNKLFNSTS